MKREKLYFPGIIPTPDNFSLSQFKNNRTNEKVSSIAKRIDVWSIILAGRFRVRFEQNIKIITQHKLKSNTRPTV